MQTKLRIWVTNKMQMMLYPLKTFCFYVIALVLRSSQCNFAFCLLVARHGFQRQNFVPADRECTFIHIGKNCIFNDSLSILSPINLFCCLFFNKNLRSWLRKIINYYFFVFEEKRKRTNIFNKIRKDIFSGEEKKYIK